MIREHGGVPFAVGEKNCADCIAGDCLFLDHMFRRSRMTSAGMYA
jgi:hypothetical protein